ncbi:MAG: hypothetical protein WAV16_00605 [Candidatus Moraniibacteriota bacterium]
MDILIFWVKCAIIRGMVKMDGFLKICYLSRQIGQLLAISSEISSEESPDTNQCATLE